MTDRRGAGGLALAVALLAGVGWFGVRAARQTSVHTLTLEERYLADDRIDRLVYPCAFGKSFDEPTVDMIPVLVSKLEFGTVDPLRVSKRELAAAGARAIPPLRTLFDEVYQDPWRHGVVENILAVCTLMDEPHGLEMIRFALGHPQQTVRLAAATGLERHGGPADYDAVLNLLPTTESGRVMADFAGCLKVLDPERFYADFAAWLEEGKYVDMWRFLIKSVCGAREPRTVERLRRGAELRDDNLALFMLAPAARDGDEAAAAILYERLNSERAGPRQLAVQVLGAIGHALDTVVLLNDPHPQVRQKVVELLAEEEPGEEVDAWLTEGLADSNTDVREVCLNALVSRGNARATHMALELLEGNVLERSAGIRALRGGWEVNPGSAEEAFKRLVRRFREATRQGSREFVSILQILSQVPLQDTADFLMDFAEQYQGRIGGLDTFRWCCGQVWNVGAPGRDLLRARLADESDPFRRLSLIEYIWQDHSDASREALMAVLGDGALSPFERLYAADRLTLMGPASRVAPALKRVYHATTHREVRPAMQCLLWTFYGQHFE